MARGKAGEPANCADPFVVEYAPTSRAICKECDGAIRENTVRFGRKVRSPWHDGFDTQWRHPECSTDYCKDLHLVTGLFSLRFDDVNEVLLAFDQPELPSRHPRVKEFFEYNAAVHRLANSLRTFSMKALEPFLVENEVAFRSDKMRAPEAAYIIAEGLLYGKLPPCPLCETRGLVAECNSIVRCRGFVQGSNTRCTFVQRTVDLLSLKKETKDETVKTKKEETVVKLEEEAHERPVIRTEPFAFPKECRRIKGFSTWKCPSDFPNAALAKTAKKVPQPSAVKGDAAKDCEQGAKKDAPKNANAKARKFEGLVFSSAGALEPSREEIKMLIETNGGSWHNENQLHPSISALLISDVKAVQQSSKYTQALRYNIPVLHSFAIMEMLGRTYDADLLPPPSRKRPQPPSSKLTSSREASFDLKRFLLGGKLSKNGELMRFERVHKLPRCFAKVKREPPVKNTPILQVDAAVPRSLASSVDIYVDEHNNVYNISTSFADLATSVNKFYKQQLLVRRFDNLYFIFRKWGRVGESSNRYNGNILDEFDIGLQGALAEFQKRCLDLTGIAFDDRFDQQPIAGRYRYIHLDDTNETSDAAVHEKENQPKEVARPPSTLPEEIQSLVMVLLDEKSMREALERENMDLSKMPLGRLSKRQLAEGLKYLSTLQELLSEKDDNNISMQRREAKLVAITSQFYTAIPHVVSLEASLHLTFYIMYPPMQFPRGKPPPPINSLQRLREKLDLMEQLREIAIARDIVDEALASSKLMAKVDAFYQGLHANIRVVKDPVVRNIIFSALQVTHSNAHTDFKLNPLELYECERFGELDRFKERVEASTSKDKQRRFLWHGSRLTNWAGIIRQGLRIAPPEAPASGYMFGKGVYFADCSSKSAQYCYATRANPEAFLCVAEVALGKPLYLFHAHSTAAKVCKAKERHHIWAVGQQFPDPSRDVTLKSSLDDADIPIASGPVIPLTQDILDAAVGDDPPRPHQPSLVHNEFIVYNESQVLLRYVLKIRFDFTPQGSGATASAAQPAGVARPSILAVSSSSSSGSSASSDDSDYEAD